MFNLEKYKNKTALILESEKTVSYSALACICKDIYSQIQKRCLVVILCENELGALAAYVSCIQNRVVPILLDAKIDKNLLYNIVEAYKPDYVICKDGCHGDLGEATYSLGDDVGTYKVVKTKFTNAYKLHDDLALLLSTSGSTGSPKFVRLSYKNLSSNAASIIEYLKITQKDVAITSLPMNYTYGLSVINTHLEAGASLVLTNSSLMQKEFWSLFDTCGVTSFSGIPYTYEMLNRLRFTRKEHPSLRQMTQAGGHLEEKLQKLFTEYCNQSSKEFVVMYGQTEATSRMAYLPAEMSLNKIGSIGIAIPNGQFCLQDDNGKVVLQPNAEGELCYKGDNVSLGYANSGEDLSLGDENNGFLKTGDLAKFDDEGYFFITGRKKRFVKIFGNRVNLDECENLLKEKFNLTELACTGNDFKICIYLKDGSLKDQATSFLANLTHLHPSAFTVKIVEDIPKNSSGKVLYQALENKALQKHKLSTEYLM